MATKTVKNKKADDSIKLTGKLNGTKPIVIIAIAAIIITALMTLKNFISSELKRFL